MRAMCRFAVLLLLSLPAAVRAEEASAKRADPFASADFSWTVERRLTAAMLVKP